MKKTLAPKIYASLNFGIFFGYVMFISGYEIKEIRKLIKKGKDNKGWLKAFDSIDHEKFKDARDIVHKIAVNDVIYYFYFMKDRFDFSDDAMCKLAHECLHLCQFSLPDYMDVNREYESFAYTHTHLMSQCLKLLRS